MMIHGMINIYKEKGYTSHDVVAKLRGILGQRKIGHTGTLDPDAQGVLPVCLGKGTKLCSLLTDQNKIYQAVLLLGRETDTQDISGQVLKQGNTEGMKEEQVRQCIEGFIGEYDQLPPMYSALKVGGRKLYELAREGKEVERVPRRVMIYGIKILDMTLPRVRMEVTCSKGTYIRTLCHDIGQALATGGCMEDLIRTGAGVFSIQDSLKLDQVAKLRDAGQLDTIIVPIDAMFSKAPQVSVSGEAMKRVYNGNHFQLPHVGNNEFRDHETIRVYDEQGVFLALYQYQKATDEFRVEKMFYERHD